MKNVQSPEISDRWRLKFQVVKILWHHFMSLIPYYRIILSAL